MNRELLSRIAETLYWIGRYVERADDIARLLDVALRRSLAGEEDGSAVFAILGHPGEPGDSRPPTAETMVRRLAYDAGEPSSIAGCVRAARENARGVRDIISSEAWECLNVTWNELPVVRGDAERLGPHVFLRYVRERAAMFSGLADATMSRDDGWRFIVLGRSLERADMTSRLLAVYHSSVADPSDPASPTWRLLLEACGADESFTRIHRGDRDRVVEFLLLDRLFPRSVMHALTTTERCLAELAPYLGRAGMADPARAAIGRIRTTLEYTEADALPAGLPEILSALQEAVTAATGAITGRFFQHTAPAGWVRGGSAWAGV
ncbi:alpha-E domain-containing protein [Microbispora sp. RL4-1S]|uniref:Alpha-E domain-containing protein n=1 Tax=Microbispora oryzae TaxID=2806554 RepID=A0A940WGZ9_9ACTN|nr:alpha-E domain-containing protein [Microbispora oryzae]MBP2703027.1 alpha-E domain-containing protein [Microbispora oryzae]